MINSLLLEKRKLIKNLDSNELYYDILIKNLIDLGEESKNLRNYLIDKYNINNSILKEISILRNDLTHTYFKTTFKKIDEFLESFEFLNLENDLNKIERELKEK